MTKEDYLKKKEELDQQYITESGILGKMYLCFCKDMSNIGSIDEWVEVFKVRSAEVEDGEIFIDKTDFCSISKYVREDGEVEYEIVELMEPKEGSDSLGIQSCIECGEVEIDEDDYRKIIDIIQGGDSDRSVEVRFNEVCEYLLRSGFKRFILIENENEEFFGKFEGD